MPFSSSWVMGMLSPFIRAVVLNLSIFWPCIKTMFQDSPFLQAIMEVEGIVMTPGWVSEYRSKQNGKGK